MDTQLAYKRIFLASLGSFRCVVLHLFSLLWPFRGCVCWLLRSIASLRSGSLPSHWCFRATVSAVGQRQAPSEWAVSSRKFTCAGRAGFSASRDDRSIHSGLMRLSSALWYIYANDTQLWRQLLSWLNLASPEQSGLRAIRGYP